MSDTSLLPLYARTPMAFVKGEGTWLWDEAGERWLDMGAGIAVNALGHAHPHLVAALKTQAEQVWHLSNLYRVPGQEKLAERLTASTFADVVAFTNSGTEACELAVKMARKYWSEKGEDRHRILAFEGAFHGRSSAAIAASGAEKMVKGFGPLLPGFTQLPWGDHDALRAALTDEIAAVIVEPIQGEGGIRVMPDVCLKGLRDLCDQTGALLILDEVQCGVGRTGKLFAHEWAGIEPDIMMLAKGIGGGFPFGAVLATAEAGSGMGVGSHGSTYAGNPLAMAVGNAVMEIVDDETFLADVRAKGGRLRQKLEGLVAAHPTVFEAVRGTGLMLGLKCRVAPAEVVKAAYAQHLITVPAADNTLRLLPPLNITNDEIDEAISRLDRAATSLS